jgi:hypothetical protein
MRIGWQLYHNQRASNRRDTPGYLKIDNEVWGAYGSGMRWDPGRPTASTLRRTIPVILLFIASLAVAADQVVFTVVDRVQFSVPGDWPVISSKSNTAKTVFAFQIPNAADEGTPDSSNIVIVSTYLKDARDRVAFEKKASNPDHPSQESNLVNGWRCSSFSALQKATEYVVWDCYRIVADCGVSVRIAWPHLPKNPPDYDNRMETVLSDFLKSVVPSKKQPK